ncbi:hypothetical protein Sste5346_010152 [Sporothrix stenoceras]|uniref:S-adenosyl-L-methionine-dependent methyltransferase n=1 Tax=Sporothrix stenoceras TaxID=5173 RepID=A0ABR3YHQ0_9PEZI
MSAGNDRFSAQAAAWDRNPDVHRASESALQAILRARPDLVEGKGTASTSGLDVLEIGCGTGLLTLRLAPYVRSIVAVDAAQGMIDALQHKLDGLNSDLKDQISPVCVLLEDPEDPALPPADATSTDAKAAKTPRRKFDLAISHLVLHHIPDHPLLLKTLFGSLKSGGELALTDFENFGPEAKRFHPRGKMDGVEFHGIEAKLFAEQVRAAGFVSVDVRPAWTMEKAVERFPGDWDAGKPQDTSQLETMSFPFLLCRGRKP